MAEQPTLVRAIRDYFQIPASEMIAEFKKLTDKDKDDFEQMFKDIGVEVTRTK